MTRLKAMHKVKIRYLLTYELKIESIESVQKLSRTSPITQARLGARF